MYDIVNSFEQDYNFGSNTLKSREYIKVLVNVGESINDPKDFQLSDKTDKYILG